MMKKILFTVLLSFLLVNTGYSQTPYRFDPRRITYGGSLGMQFGDYTAVSIAPQVGYTFNQYFNAGLGLAYAYYKEDFYTHQIKYKSSRSYFGMNVYAKFYPTNFLVFMLQPEGNRMWDTTESVRTSEKVISNKFVASVVVGGGLRFGPLTAMLKYDIVQDKDSPYGKNLFYSVGFTF